ncbi:MAG TPA: hypothetical protein VMI52_15100 [Acetobacteraceae bacterium]|nr:hypothetical protein [Acetobacteraceae bacterium]
MTVRSGRRGDGPGGNILAGMLLLARGRARGLAAFGDTSQAFLASLAPLIAFPLVEAGLLLMQGNARAAAAGFLQTLCTLLMPPVVSQFLAWLWGREAGWLRYATALNWAQWVVPLALALLLPGMALALHGGVPPQIAFSIGLILVAGYGLWLQWFLARHGLGLSRSRAALLVLVVGIATAAVTFGPTWLAGGGMPALTVPA